MRLKKCMRINLTGEAETTTNKRKLLLIKELKSVEREKNSQKNGRLNMQKRVLSSDDLIKISIETALTEDCILLCYEEYADIEEREEGRSKEDTEIDFLTFVSGFVFGMDNSEKSEQKIRDFFI